MKRGLAITLAAALTLASLAAPIETLAVETNQYCTPTTNSGVSGGQYCQVDFVYDAMLSPYGWASGNGRFRAKSTRSSCASNSLPYRFKIDPKKNNSKGIRKTVQTTILNWEIRLPSNVELRFTFTENSMVSSDTSVLIVSNGKTTDSGVTLTYPGEGSPGIKGKGGTERRTNAKRFNLRLIATHNIFEYQMICLDSQGRVTALLSRATYQTPSATESIWRVELDPRFITPSPSGGEETPQPPSLTHSLTEMSGTDNWGMCVSGEPDKPSLLNLPANSTRNVVTSSSKRLGVGLFIGGKGALSMGVTKSTGVTATFANLSSLNRIACTTTDRTVLRGKISDLIYTGSSSGTNNSNPAVGTQVAITTP